MSNEVKVGLLLVVALGVLAWLTMAGGMLGFSKSVPMREMYSVFFDVEGIKEGSPVKMAGVDIGEVIRVDLQPTGTAILRFKVRQSVALPADVSAQITASGLIGERYVALVPGRQGVHGDGGLLDASVVEIPALGTADPANISTDVAKMADDMKGITASLKQVLGDPENAKKLQGIIDGLSSFSESLGGGDANSLKDLGKAAKNLAEISENLKNGKGTLGQLLVDNGNDTQQNLSGTLEQLNAAVADFRAVMHKINSGEGTLGRLVNDESTADKLDETLDSVNGLTRGVSGFFGGGSVSGTDGRQGSRLGGFRAEGTLEAVNVLSEDNIYKGSANARLQAGQRFVDVGVTGDGFASEAKSSDNVNGPYYGKDFGSEMKYTAQVGQEFGDVALRAGLKNSTAGVGADVYGRVPLAGTPVRYSADFYDFGGANTPGDDAHLDLMARADLTKRVYGVVGYDNVLNDKFGGPVVGLGVRFQTRERTTAAEAKAAEAAAVKTGAGL